MLQRSSLSRIERSRSASTSTPSVQGLPSLLQRPCQRRLVKARATELADALSQMLPHLPLEMVAPPCQVMKCGDIVYRSTLDPTLYKSGGFDWKSGVLLATVLGYLFLPPGVLPGAIDYYLTAALRRKDAKAIDKSDIILGKRLGTGGFGTVFKGEIKEEDGSRTPIIIKKAKEFGEAEVWMNERMSRVAGNHTAEFVTAFDESLSEPGGSTAAPAGPLDNSSIWLVWKYEGDNTLMGLMEKRDYPYNLEPLLFGRELRAPRGPARELVTIKEAMRQLLSAVAACHRNGIVHRDIKPANCIVSTRDKKIKLIDLGAAADLRIGINYVPNEYLLDPRYAPPQQYIMSTQTPRPPPKPVAAFLSPVLWAMERPDRFDMYSCGVCMVQMLFAHLRNDNALIAFNKRLQELKWDLAAWRAEEEDRLASGQAKAAVAESLEAGFEALAADGGAGWDLLGRLLAYKPTDRLSADEALAHPWLTNAPGYAASLQRSLGGTVSATVSSAAAATSTAFTTAGKTLGRVADVANMEEAILKTKQGALTESQLMEELGLQERAPVAPREASQTIAWWQERQNELRVKLAERREGQSDGPAGAKGAKGAAAAAKKQQPAAAAAAGGSGKLKVPAILGGPKKAGSGGSNGNGNGKAAAVANGNGKAAAVVNGNGLPRAGSPARGQPSNSNGNGKAAANGLGKQLFARAAANGNGNGNGKGSTSEDEEEVEVEEKQPVSKKERAFDILGVFRR